MNCVTMNCKNNTSLDSDYCSFCATSSDELKCKQCGEFVFNDWLSCEDGEFCNHACAEKWKWGSGRYKPHATSGESSELAKDGKGIEDYPRLNGKIATCFLAQNGLVCTHPLGNDSIPIWLHEPAQSYAKLAGILYSLPSKESVSISRECAEDIIGALNYADEHDPEFCHGMSRNELKAALEAK